VHLGKQLGNRPVRQQNS